MALLALRLIKFRICGFQHDWRQKISGHRLCLAIGLTFGNQLFEQGKVSERINGCAPLGLVLIGKIF